jgi:hypothetical protein
MSREVQYRLSVAESSDEKIVRPNSGSDFSLSKSRKTLMISRHKGKLIEEIAKMDYEARGYKVLKLVLPERGHGELGVVYTKELVKALASEKFKKRFWPIADLTEQLSFSGLPDFLVYNDEEFFFVEAKTNPHQISKLQRGVIEKLKKMGYRVEVYSKKVKLDLTLVS